MRLNLFNKLRTDNFAWFKNNFTVVLIISAFAAMLISLWIGLAQSVWFDEAYSIMLAKQPIGQLIHLTSIDTHPPFYYILLNIWGNIFGWSEFALRSMSALFMGGAVILAGLFVKKAFGIKAALASIIFVSFAPMLLRYGFEIRMYSLASLIGIAATYVLVLALESKDLKKSRLFYAIYAILVALGVFTLYYTVLLWVAHLLWLAWRSYSQKESILKAKWPRAFILSVILFLPWLPTFIHQISNGALAPISQSMTIENLFGVVSFNFLYRPVWQLGALLSLVALFITVMIIILSVRAFKIIDKKQKPYLVLIFMYILVPIIILTVVGLVKPMYTERYLSHVLIGGILLVGIIISIVTTKSSRNIKILSYILPIFMIIGIVQLSQVGNYNFQRLQKPNPKQAALIMSDCDSNRVVLAADPYVAIELDYYLTHCKINFYSENASLGGGYAPLSNSPLRISDPQTQLKSADVIYYAHYGDSALKMPDNLQFLDSETFGSLTVERFGSGQY